MILSTSKNGYLCGSICWIATVSKIVIAAKCHDNKKAGKS